jgi:6-phosphogluconolactonase (cycloisomerase 2 family)
VGRVAEVGAALHRRWTISLAALVAFLVPATTAFAALGEIDQVDLGDTDACVSEDGSAANWKDGNALLDARAVTVSPDGRHVYVASDESHAVVAFIRDRTTSALNQVEGIDGCISDDGTGGTCENGTGLSGARSVAITPDGKHVYVASCAANAVAAFKRNKKTGALTQLAGTDACVSDTGSGGCVDGRALNAPFSIAMSHDGKNVYVASGASGGVAAFKRKSKTGVLAQLPGLDACITESGSGRVRL